MRILRRTKIGPEEIVLINQSLFFRLKLKRAAARVFFTSRALCLKIENFRRYFLIPELLPFFDSLSYIMI